MRKLYLSNLKWFHSIAIKSFRNLESTKLNVNSKLLGMVSCLMIKKIEKGFTVLIQIACFLSGETMLKKK